MNKFHSGKIAAASLLLFVSGIILYNGEVDYAIIRFFNNLFPIHLNETFRAIGLGYVSTLLIYASLVSFLFLLSLKGKTNQTQFVLLSCIALIIHYGFYVFKTSVNYPIFDDQGAILGFLNDYSNATSAKEKVDLIFSPYFESLQTLPRIFLLLIWKIFHSVNFRYLQCANVLSLVLFVFLLLKNFLKSKSTLVYFLLLGLFIFQLQSYDTSLWAISGICYYWVLIFSFLSFQFLLDENSNKRILSLFFATAAALTFGNGFLLFPVAVIYLLKKKRWREAIVWTSVFIFLLFIYSRHISDAQPVSGMSFNISDWILFIPGLLGTSFQFFYTLHLPVLAGTFIIGVFLISFFKQWYLNSKTTFMMLGFLILSAIVAAPFRNAIIPGGYYVLQVRYGFFSSVAFVLAIILLLENTNIFRNKTKIFFAVALTYNLLTGIFFYPEAVLRKRQLILFKNDAARNIFHRKFSAYREGAFEKLMNESIEKGIYKPE